MGGGGGVGVFFFSSRRRHTRFTSDWSSDVCSSDLGTQVRVVSDPELKDERHLFVDYPHLTEQLGQGNHILLDSGLVKLEILENHGDSLACRVLDGGTITPKRHVNLPGISVKLPGITLSDRKDLEFALEENVDVVALSFLRNRDTDRRSVV